MSTQRGGPAGERDVSTPETSGPAWDLLVDRHDLRRRTVREVAVPEPAAGEVLVRVDAFALTANNLTYAVTGDRFGYWRLFPADGRWGRVPAWGVGTVVRSRCADVEVGERFAGMVPMSAYLVVQPRRTRDGVADLAAHRAEVNPVYNRYIRVTDRADADLERDAALRPVYVLSFALAHHLRTAGWLGAGRLLVTSASSKAALGLAHALAPDDVAVVGLTSPRHLDLVRAVGRFDGVTTYDRFGDLPVGVPTGLVDVGGNAEVRERLRDHLGPSLVAALHVGQTDWEQPDDRVLGSPGGGTAFFAPTVVQQLVADWGPAEYARRLEGDLHAFTSASSAWLHPDHRDGAGAAAGAYDDVAAGAVPPDRFVVVRPHAARPSSPPSGPGSA